MKIPNKVTEEYIKSRIKETKFSVLPETTMTLCYIRMVNGFIVLGESACVDPNNFDEQLGKEIAFKNAMGKLWALEGYVLAESRYRFEAMQARDKANG